MLTLTDKVCHAYSLGKERVEDVIEMVKIAGGLSNKEFEESLRHKNLIFSNGIDLIYEFFNLERKSKNSILGKTVQYLGKNSNVNDFFTKIADRGFIL